MLCKTLSHLSPVTKAGGWLFGRLVVLWFSFLVNTVQPPNRLTVVWSFSCLESNRITV